MRVRASVLWVRLLLVCLGVTLTLPTGAFAVAYDISINTAALVGTSAPLAFDFIAGGASANTATVTGFTTDGSLGSALTTGAVSGALPGAVTLTTPGLFFNEYLSNLQLGTGVSFSLTTTVTGPSGLAFPDQFSFFLLNAGTGVPLFPTTDPTGAGALFALTLDGSPSGILSVYSGGPLSWTMSASPAAAVPEPSTWLLLLPGIVGLWAWRRRLPLTSSSTTPLARAVRTHGTTP